MINAILQVLREDADINEILRKADLKSEHKPYFARRKAPVDQSACILREFWSQKEGAELRRLLEIKHGIDPWNRGNAVKSALLIRLDELRRGEHGKDS